jgi:RHS repeat-associated protein
MKIKLILPVVICISCLQTEVLGEAGDDNPTGVSGQFNGNITSGCSYDAYTGNATRVVDDIVVPGSVGAYPLKWTRYWNSHTNSSSFNGARWSFSYMGYSWAWNFPALFPDGRALTGVDYGVEEFLDHPYNAQCNCYPQATIHLADGGQVILTPVSGTATYLASKIIDPYGQVTTIVTTGTGGAKTTKITEPGGRYLLVNYDNGGLNVTQVQAFDGVSPQPTQSVVYTWTAETLRMPDGTHPNSYIDLKQVDYSDGTSATYTYKQVSYLGPCVCSNEALRQHFFVAVLATADDVRFAGPMRQIAYTYQSSANGKNGTRILSESHLVNGQAGEAVSTITGLGTDNNPTITATETRGDGPTRTLTYYKSARTIDCIQCTEAGPPDPQPTDGKLQTYTDFLGHTTTSTYETDITKPSAGYITGVTDANNNRTTYTRSGLSWGILSIIHPDLSHIDQTYTDEAHPYYLASKTDERGETRIYTRDTNNRITRKDYPDGGYETFDYGCDSFDEVCTRVRAKDASTTETESFTYDGRGLKTSYTDATGGITVYTYYGANDPIAGNAWIDRLKTVTHPANASGYQVSDTYEYDRTFVNGVDSGTPCAGRGSLTKITHDDVSHPDGTHGDGTYQTFAHDTYGNLLSTTDELGHTMSHSYDAYKRLLTTTDPLGHPTTNNYVPTGKTSSWITTSALPFSTTLPSTKNTNFYYDANWRKTQVQQAPGTADEADTYFYYDHYGAYTSIGNLLATQDPRNYFTTYHYDIRDRRDMITDALGTSLGDPNHTTSFTFDFCSNKSTETHPKPDTNTASELIEYDGYDPMNRLTHKKVHRDTTTIDQTSTTYDLAGNLHTNTDEDGNIYSYTYDSMNRRLSMIDPDTTKHEDSTYDAAGNVATYRNRAGNVQTFTYDNRSRQTGFSWNDSGTTPWQSATYDAASRVKQIANTISTINNAYLDDNRLSTQEEWTSVSNDNVHRTVTYTYDVDGNRLTVQYPSGAAFNYTYTNRNQVASINPGLSGGTAVASYVYDASGNIRSRALDNGTSTAYTVDAVNRDTAVAHSLVGTTRRFDYAYNNVNDITAVQRDSANGDGFTYDLTQEIVGLQLEATSINLSTGTVTGGTPNNMLFDGCGNRTTLNGVNQTFNNMNQPTGTGLGYTTNGSLKTWNGWTYTYDAQNRLTNATNGAVTAIFKYDGKNRQVARSINGAVTFSVWDDWELVEEYGTGNVRTAAYLQGAHGPIKSLLNNVYFYQDELGSTSHIANTSGALLEYYKYGLYGKPTYFDSNGNPLTSSSVRDLFTGQRWITEIGLYDDRNRFMSPDLGRFLQPDPIGFKGDASSLYRYCGNDWANKNDPMGLAGDDGLPLPQPTPPPNQQQQLQQQPTYHYLGNDRTKTTRPDPRGMEAPRTLSREGNTDTTERVFASTVPPRQPFSRGLGGASAALANYSSTGGLGSLSNFARNHLSLDLNINTPGKIGGNLGINNKGIYGNGGVGPGGFAEATLTVNLNFGEVPRGQFAGVTGAIADAGPIPGVGIAGRFSSGYSENGGFYFNFGFGVGAAANIAVTAYGGGGYIYEWGDDHQ